MATFDVRDQNDAIHEVRFADDTKLLNGKHVDVACVIVSGIDYCDIMDGNGNSLALPDKVTAENMIKALQKVIQLKWVK